MDSAAKPFASPFRISNITGTQSLGRRIDLDAFSRDYKCKLLAGMKKPAGRDVLARYYVTNKVVAVIFPGDTGAFVVSGAKSPEEASHAAATLARLLEPYLLPAEPLVQEATASMEQLSVSQK